ncbi:organic hydroperoxide resistance protein [Spirosoma oryzae]|nr:organic hydroperoxide resistance protein [Spirosoma oryzae]
MNTTIMHTGQAKSVGGRDGQVTSNDNILNLELTLPKSLGGRAREGATNPEQLFAAGYAACFGGAVGFHLRADKLTADEIAVDATVDMFLNDEKLPTLAVTMRVNLPGLTQEQAETIVAKAHETCPYSRATRGNIDVAITVTTNPA